MTPRSLLVLPALAVLAAGALSPAQAAPPKPFSKTVAFSDRTPDPSGLAGGAEHCKGELPAEQPVVVDIPAAGAVAIAVSGFQGDWSLMITNDKGAVLGTADTDPPATESTTLKLKKAGKISILPCNIAGTFDATLTYSWTPKR